MNPKISIVVDSKNKAIASLSGMVTVGAKMDVEIAGLTENDIPSWDPSDDFYGKSLRLRIVDAMGRDLVRFPRVKKTSAAAQDGDQWTIDSSGTGDVFKTQTGTTGSPEVNFDTDRLRAAFNGVPFNDTLEFGIILDSIVDAAQYATGRIKVKQWSAASTEDPTVVTDWRETLVRLDAATASVTKVGTTATISITNTHGVTTTATVSDGATGAQGATGPQGATGAAIVSQTKTGVDADGGYIYTQTFDDDSTQTFTAPRGPQGPAGADGADGADGATGPQGETGPQGPTGPRGPMGYTGLQGPKGDKGDTGEKGDKGDTGSVQWSEELTPEQIAQLKGPKGDTGDKGEKGDTGETGPRGPMGYTGLQGPKGDPGNPTRTLIGESMAMNPTQRQMTVAFKKVWQALGGTFVMFAIEILHCLFALDVNAEVTRNTEWQDVPPDTLVGTVVDLGQGGGGGGMIPNAIVYTNSTLVTKDGTHTVTASNVGAATAEDITAATNAMEAVGTDMQIVRGEYINSGFWNANVYYSLYANADGRMNVIHETYATKEEAQAWAAAVTNDQHFVKGEQIAGGIWTIKVQEASTAVSSTQATNDSLNRNIKNTYATKDEAQAWAAAVTNVEDIVRGGKDELFGYWNINVMHSAQAEFDSNNNYIYTTYATKDEVSAIPTTYAMTNRIVSLNCSAQYIVADGTPITIAVPTAVTGGVRDWIVYANATADTALNLANLGGILCADTAYTNALAANKVTALYITEMTNNVYVIGRQELTPVK